MLVTDPCVRARAGASAPGSCAHASQDMHTPYSRSYLQLFPEEEEGASADGRCIALSADLFSRRALLRRRSGEPAVARQQLYTCWPAAAQGTGKQFKCRPVQGGTFFRVPQGAGRHMPASRRRSPSNSREN